MEKILGGIWDAIISNIYDWIITVVITYITVRIATRRYYDSTKKKVSASIMELGLRSLLNLGFNEELPGGALVIFVEYKGRCYKFKDRNMCDENKIKFLRRIRKTRCVVGEDKEKVSSYRPRDYGVLGVANILSLPVLYDFKKGELFVYESGRIEKVNTIQRDDKNYYKVSEKREIYISPQETSRDVMIAIPIKKSGKFVGGITFDLTIDSKTVYQRIHDKDTDEIKQNKVGNNIKVFKDTVRTAHYLSQAYFRKKGDEDS